MKKISLVMVAVLGIALLSFSIASPALAADLVVGGSGSGNSRGTRGGEGNTSVIGTDQGIPVRQDIHLDGALEDFLHENLAAGLGITLAELEARLDAGETVSEIGLSLDFEQEAILEIISQAWTVALAEAVGTGTLTQEQADWMASRGSRSLAGLGEGLCEAVNCTPETSKRGNFQRAQRQGYGQ